MLQILKSTLIVVFISALGSLGAFLLNFNFIATFILLFVFQFIIFSFIGNVITSFFQEKTRQKELDLLEPLSTILQCAYCNKENLMTFFPNDKERIEFECDACNKKNLVTIGFSVARITEPINIPNLTGVPLVEDKKS